MLKRHHFLYTCYTVSHNLFCQSEGECRICRICNGYSLFNQLLLFTYLKYIFSNFLEVSIEKLKDVRTVDIRRLIKTSSRKDQKPFILCKTRLYSRGADVMCF